MPRVKIRVKGRLDRHWSEWFDGLRVSLVAEHGAWVKCGERGWETTQPQVTHWKREVLPILQMHSDRLPGSFVEEKDFSLVWHYRAADPERALTRASEVVDDLVAFTANIDVRVLHGNKVVEVKNAGFNKGTACLRCLGPSNPDFLLAVGDDVTDEDLFEALPETAYSIKVGAEKTQARFYLPSHPEVLELLEVLVSACEPSPLMPGGGEGALGP